MQLKFQEIHQNGKCQTELKVFKFNHLRQLNRFNLTRNLKGVNSQFKKKFRFKISGLKNYYYFFFFLLAVMLQFIYEFRSLVHRIKRAGKVKLSNSIVAEAFSSSNDPTPGIFLKPSPRVIHKRRGDIDVLFMFL